MLQRVGRVTGIVLFVVGLVSAVVAQWGVRAFSEAKTDNFVAPGGRFFDGKPAFRFAVMGDSGLRNEPMEAVLQDIRKKDFAFIIHVGDMARHFTSSHFEWLAQELHDDTGDLPFYAVPGNHDITSRQDDIRRLRYYKRIFGQPNYWFSYGDVLFVCLDTSTNDLTDADLAWLEGTLKRLRKMFKSCVMVMHVPPIDPRPDENHCMVDGVERLRQLVGQYDVNALFAGHIHEYSESDFGGAPLYIGPPSGETRRGGTTRFGYMAATVAPDGAVSVEAVPVTDKEGRKRVEYFVSTSVQRHPVAETGLVLMAAGFCLVVFLRKPDSRRGDET